MSLARFYFIFLIGQSFAILAFAQESKSTLDEAFKAAKQTGKPLLVIRYDQQMISYPKTYHDETSDSRLDAILNKEPNKQAMADEIVVYRLRADSLNTSDAQFQDQFLLDYTPNFILFSSEGEFVHFYNPIPSDLSAGDVDVLGGLRDTLKTKEAELQLRSSLQGKFDTKAIATPELVQLVTMRTNAHLKSRDALNELALRKVEIPESLLQPLLSQGLKTTDPIVQYILENFKPKNLDWAFYKTYLIESLFENAKAKKDKTEFENVLLLKGDYSTQAINMASEAYPDYPMFDGENRKEYLDEQLLSEKFDFYASISDTVNVRKYGLQYANYILHDYEERKQAVVDDQIEMSDYMTNSFVLTGDAKQDSVVLAIRAAYEKNKEFRRKKEEQNFDSENARILNHISWTFFEVITEKPDLEKALGWSQKSVELEDNLYYLDTYAHLLFKLGFVDKAIEQETKALEKLKSYWNTQLIQKFESELNRFKQSGKD